MFITIKTNKGDFTLSWSNDELIRYYEFHQSAGFFHFLPSPVDGPSDISMEHFTHLLTRKIQRMTDLFFMQIDEELPLDLTIMNIGSGASTIDLLLAKYYPSANIYLVDRDEFALMPDSLLFTDNTKDSSTVFQNSWKPFEDGVLASGLNRKRFTLLDPLDEWPTSIDLINSIWSWGWHYSYPDYISRLENLKSGGKLRLTVLTLPDTATDFINEISSCLGNEPVVHPFILDSTPRTRLQYGESKQHGGYYVWKKE